MNGFSMIEVMIAMLLSVIVAGATAELLVTGSHASGASQRQTELVAVADQQIENIRQQVKTNAAGFASLAMTSAPSHSTDPTNPNYFVGDSNTSYLIENNYDVPSAGTVTGVPTFTGVTAGAEPLYVSAGGFVMPLQTGVQVGGSTATASVYSYVTSTFVGCNTAALGGTCAGDARRVVVAVKLDQVGSNKNLGQNTPTYASTTFTNPVPSNQPNSTVGITLGLNVG